MPPHPRAPAVKLGEVDRSIPTSSQVQGGGGKKMARGPSPRPRPMPSSYGGGYGGGYGGMNAFHPMMGMGMMGMGMGMGGLMDNPLMRWMYVLNSSMYMLGQVGTLLYMNVNSMYGVIRNITDCYRKLKEIMSKSSTLLWLRSKTRKSKILRWLLILLSMYLTSKIYHLLKRFISSEYARRISGGAGAAMAASYDGVEISNDSGANSGVVGEVGATPISTAAVSSDGSNVNVSVGGDVDGADLEALNAV